MKNMTRTMILGAAIALAASGPAFAADNSRDERLALPQVDIAIEIVKDDDDLAGSVDLLTDPQGSEEVHVELPHLDNDTVGGTGGAGSAFAKAGLAKDVVANSGGTPPVGPSDPSANSVDPQGGGAIGDDSPDGVDDQGVSNDSQDDSHDESIDDSQDDSFDDHVAGIEDSVDELDDNHDGIDDSMDDVEDSLDNGIDDSQDGGGASTDAGMGDLN